MNEQPQRRRPAHGVRLFPDQPTIVFATVCTKGRRPWLASETVHRQLCEIWRSALTWRMGSYVILPDHLHFFAEATDSQIAFDTWVTYWKSMFSKQRSHVAYHWQSGHWEIRIRNKQAFEEKMEYVRWNPVRAGLVDDPQDWPFQGEIHELIWE